MTFCYINRNVNLEILTRCIFLQNIADFGQVLPRSFVHTERNCLKRFSGCMVKIEKSRKYISKRSKLIFDRSKVVETLIVSCDLFKRFDIVS